MKLTTANGQLDLPQDFNITMERTNPLLSGEGDATIPATLPASPRNLAALGHRERIDRANPYTNKIEAILQAGPVQKHGQLVIDTVHRREGIEASFAIDSSDLYVKSKNKTLKEIFAEWNDGEGYKETFNDVDEACGRMEDIYQHGTADGDYVIFPVAVASYEEGDGDDKVTEYQFNNEDDGQGGLVYKERVVREDDINMLVPKGYGVAPFLKLQRLIQRLFECLGYTVTYNCFDESPFYSQIAIVHNCADCLVTNVLYYADLVPSCTLSEFLEWLLAKFHVQPVVDSESKKARVVRMESTINSITGNYDMDISALVEGDWKVQLNPSKRIVLTPTCEIEGTEPAAETFDKLIEKYGFYVDCDEDMFDSLSGDSPEVSDCLISRKSTGMFYLLERRLDNGKTEARQLGTNYFTYDRANSDDTEAFSQADTMPLMIVEPAYKRGVCPYIGERIHRHTSYNGKADDSEQKIIAVQAHTSEYFSFPTTGTTQKKIPYASGDITYSFYFGMDNYSMHNTFWLCYNTLLLNCPVHLTGRVKYSVADFLGMDMSVPKLCGGQKLLPVKATARIGEKMGITEAEFIHSKFSLGDGDTAIAPSESPELRWERAAYDENGDAFDEEGFCRELFRRFNEQNQLPPKTYMGFSVEFEEYEGKSVWIGTPISLGETRRFSATGKYKVKYGTPHYENGVIQGYDEYELPADGDLVHSPDYYHYVVIVFTAVAV